MIPSVFNRTVVTAVAKAVREGRRGNRVSPVGKPGGRLAVRRAVGYWPGVQMRDGFPPAIASISSFRRLTKPAWVVELAAFCQQRLVEQNLGPVGEPSDRRSPL